MAIINFFRQKSNVSILFSMLIFITLISCNNNENKELKRALKISKENSGELKSALKFFNSDTLKLKATKFLIINIANYEKNYVTINDGFYEVIDSLFNLYSDSIFQIDSYKKIEHLLTKKDSKPCNNNKYKADINSIKKEFLIDYVNNSFNIWKNKPWSKHFNFDEFCQYILPYRQQYPNWLKSQKFFEQRLKLLPDSLKQSKNCIEISKFIENDIKGWYHGDWGDCYHKVVFLTTAYRSIGIPTAFECVPHWGNMTAQRHYFYKIMNQKNTVVDKITNENIPFDSRNIIPGSFFDITNSVIEGKLDSLTSLIDSKYHTTFNKTVPKVFRYCFDVQKESLGYKLSNNDVKIPSFFINNRLKDVTNEYVKTSTVCINVLFKTNHKYAYLCVFDKKGWIPVHWGVIKNGKVTFKNMGRYIVYLPVIYSDNELKPINSPFILTKNGIPSSIIPKSKKEIITLYRKNFITTHLIDNASQCLDARIQGANKSDYSDTITLYKINKIPFFKNDIKIDCNRKFRYLLLQYGDNERITMAGIEFLYNEEKNLYSICKGTVIGNQGSPRNTYVNLFDDNPLTYYKKDLNSPYSFVGIDLGKNNLKKISKIVFYPRNDGNYIENGDLYELFYWNNEWISLGKKIGDGNHKLIYNNSPVGALLWLKNHTKGKEERIFIYQNGKQIWW